MRVLDLFSGIGGFSLGLERAGFETVAFCEIDEAAQKVLKKHWPHVPVFEDVKTLTKGKLEEYGIKKIDVICGGFPCQDVSVAGKRAGLAGQRSGLWAEYCRLVSEIGPEWVIIENVSALRSNGLATVLENLWEVGYDAEWHIIPASAIGAGHGRERIWIIAYPGSKGLQRPVIENITGCDWKEKPFLINHTMRDWFDELRRPGSRIRLDNGLPRKLASDAVRQYGNAVVPQIPEMIGRAIMRQNGN